MKILLLMGALSGFTRSNHLMFHNSFLARGDEVYIGRVNSLALERGKVLVELCCPRRAIEPGDSFEEQAEYGPVDSFDLIWLMNQPHPGIQKDVYEILWLLRANTTFVNDLASIVFLNNKTTLGVFVPSDHMIESYSSASADRLLAIQKGSTAEWVIKPTNDGNGTDVFVLRQGDSNCTPLIQSMTGNEVTQTEIHGTSVTGLLRRYAVLQRFVSHARECEKRVVLAGGKPVSESGVWGVYQTVFVEEDHRSNRIHTPNKLAVGLTPDEARLCSEVGERLVNHGVRFAAIDMAYPYVFEVNIVNPGGLQSIDLITGVDLTGLAVEQILASLSRANREPAGRAACAA